MKMEEGCHDEEEDKYGSNVVVERKETKEVEGNSRRRVIEPGSTLPKDCRIPAISENR
jgi:hypothetical protein